MPALVACWRAKIRLAACRLCRRVRPFLPFGNGAEGGGARAFSVRRQWTAARRQGKACASEKAPVCPLPREKGGPNQEMQRMATGHACMKKNRCAPGNSGAYTCLPSAGRAFWAARGKVALRLVALAGLRHEAAVRRAGNAGRRVRWPTFLAENSTPPCGG